MSTNFPTSIDSLTNPEAGSALNSPSHSDQHINSNDAIEALEAKVGADGSEVTTSHDYKIAQLESGKEDTLGFTPENVANKRTTFQATPTDTAYPSEKLVKDSLDLKQNILSEGAFVNGDKTKLDSALQNISEDTTPQLGGQLDVNGQALGDGTLELLKFSETASAVNEITVKNAATGNAPELQATGDDTNIDLNLVTKGTGEVLINGSPISSGGSSLWTAVAGSPTRTGNTTFTVTDTSNANNYDKLYSRGTCLKWTESSVLKQAMIVSATYATNTVTVTIMGDTMASIDADSLKYFSEKARVYKWAIAGTIGATGTNLGNTIMCELPGKIFGADIWAGTAGNGTTTVDINNGGTSMFTTKPSITTTNQSDLGNTADNRTETDTGDFLTIDVDAVAATTKIVDLYVNLYYIPLYNSYLE